MTDPDTILTECMAQHGVTDMDADAPVVLRFLRGWLAYKQQVADDGPWDESYLVERSP